MDLANPRHYLVITVIGGVLVLAIGSKLNLKKSRKEIRMLRVARITQFAKSLYDKSPYVIVKREEYEHLVKEYNRLSGYSKLGVYRIGAKPKPSDTGKR